MLLRWVDSRDLELGQDVLGKIVQLAIWMWSVPGPVRGLLFHLQDPLKGVWKWATVGLESPLGNRNLFDSL